MVSEDIKYDFSQIETGITAFVGDLQLKMQKVLPELPVFILQSGDTAYIIKDKFERIDGENNKEIYEKTPRMVLEIDDIQPQNDQDTNKYNKYTYKFKDVEYICQFRRQAVQIPINVNFVSSNMILGFQNFEIFLSIMKSKSNVFTYEFLGNTIEGGYAFSSVSMDKPGMDFSSATRNFNNKNMVDLQLQLMVPNLDSIQKLSDAGYTAVKFDINTKPGNENHILFVDLYENDNQ